MRELLIVMFTFMTRLSNSEFATYGFSHPFSSIWIRMDSIVFWAETYYDQYMAPSIFIRAVDNNGYHLSHIYSPEARNGLVL